MTSSGRVRGLPEETERLSVSQHHVDGVGERELLDDTLRVLSLSFSYLEGPASIDAYLTQRDNRGDSAWLLYSSLGTRGT